MHDVDSYQRNRTLAATSQRPVDWRLDGGSITGAAIMEMPELIQAARGGDDLAFSHLINHYQAAAQRLAQQILRTEEAAADAVQDALIKVHRALPRFHDGNFRSWLLRIVTNTCYDYLRSQRRRSTVSLDELTEPAGAEFPQLRTDEQQNPETLVTQQESLQYLLTAIEALPAWHRDVVLLIDVQGYDYTEASEILGLPLGTIKSRLSRARSTLRDQLLKAGVVTAPTQLSHQTKWASISWPTHDSIPFKLRFNAARAVRSAMSRANESPA